MHVVETDPAQGVQQTLAAPAAGQADVALSGLERRGLIAAGDFIAGALACGLAFYIHRGHLHSLPPQQLAIFGAIWVVSLVIADGYGVMVPSQRIQSAIAVVRALPIAALLAVGDFFLQPYVLNRPIVLLALGIGALALIAARVTVDRLLLRESFAARAVLLSDREMSPDLAATLQAARYESRVMTTLVRTPEQQKDSARLLDDVTRALGDHRAHQLIVTNHELRLVPGLTEQCLTRGVRVVSGSDLVERYLGLVPLDSVDVHWYMGLPANDLLDRPYALARRIADIVLAILASIPFLVLLPFAALAIRLESRGPIFLKQRRVGENGRPIDIYKLRTMMQDAESTGPRLAEQADPRITKVGRVLRATRLDEAPQMFNIIRGDMSFIGPRPERPEFVALFEQQVPHFRSRLLVKPGLTGWAQVKGGYASTLPEIRRKLEYDLYYIKNRSLRLDLTILSVTLIAVLGFRGR